jgi:hypothetical protein
MSPRHKGLEIIRKKGTAAAIPFANLESYEKRKSCYIAENG